MQVIDWRFSTVDRILRGVAHNDPDAAWYTRCSLVRSRRTAPGAENLPNGNGYGRDRVGQLRVERCTTAAGEDSPWSSSAIRLPLMQGGLPRSTTFGQRYDHHQLQLDFRGGSDSRPLHDQRWPRARESCSAPRGGRSDAAVFGCEVELCDAGGRGSGGG